MNVESLYMPREPSWAALNGWAQMVEFDHIVDRAVLAEYGSVRAEIQQLNAQIISISTGALALNVSVLGWFFAKESPLEFCILPTIGVFLLVLANTVLLNRNRLAHRLALFQKYFLEPQLPGIRWASVYFNYRELRNQKRGLATRAEELTDSAFLLVVGMVNVVIMIIMGLLPYLTIGSRIVDWTQVVSVGASVILLAVGCWLQAPLSDYAAIETAIKQLAADERPPGDA